MDSFWTAKCLYCAKEINVSVFEDHVIRCLFKYWKNKASKTKKSKSQKAKKCLADHQKIKRPRKKVRGARALIDRFAQRPSKGKRSRKKVRIVQGGLPSLGKRK